MHREEVIRASRSFLTLGEAAHFEGITYYAARNRYRRGAMPAVARCLDGSEFRVGETVLIDAFALRDHLPEAKRARLTDFIMGRSTIPVGARSK